MSCSSCRRGGGESSMFKIDDDMSSKLREENKRLKDEMRSLYPNAVERKIYSMNTREENEHLRFKISQLKRKKSRYSIDDY